MYISVMASVHNWVTIACEYHVTVWMPHVKFPFYIYIDIYYGLLVRVIHTLFVWVGSRKCYTLYIVFSSQYFSIFFLFFVYIFLYFSCIFEKFFLFSLLYFSIQILEGLCYMGMFFCFGASTFYPIQDGRRANRSPCQFFPCNFYNHRN